MPKKSSIHRNIDSAVCAECGFGQVFDLRLLTRVTDDRRRSDSGGPRLQLGMPACCDDQLRASGSEGLGNRPSGAASADAPSTTATFPFS